MRDAQVQITDVAESLQPFCLFLWAWRELVLVSDFQMRDVVSVYIHGTLPKRNHLIQLGEKKMENTFGLNLGNKNRDGLRQPALLCENKNIPEWEPASVLTVT